MSRKVDACTIMRDPDGRSRGFAFLTFEDPESVTAVLARNHILDGKSVRHPLPFHLPNVDVLAPLRLTPNALFREKNI